MSTHNICFYGELTKIILQFSSNPSSVLLPKGGPNEYPQHMFVW